MHKTLILLTTILPSICDGRISYSIDDNMTSDEVLHRNLRESGKITSAFTNNFRNDSRNTEKLNNNKGKRNYYDEHKEDKKFWKDIWTTDDFRRNSKLSTSNNISNKNGDNTITLLRKNGVNDINQNKPIGSTRSNIRNTNEIIEDVMKEDEHFWSNSFGSASYNKNKEKKPSITKKLNDDISINIDFNSYPAKKVSVAKDSSVTPMAMEDKKVVSTIDEDFNIEYDIVFSLDTTSHSYSYPPNKQKKEKKARTNRRKKRSNDKTPKVEMLNYISKESKQDKYSSSSSSSSASKSSKSSYKSRSSSSSSKKEAFDLDESIYELIYSGLSRNNNN